MALSLVSLNKIDKTQLELFTCTKLTYGVGEEENEYLHQRIDDFLINKASIYEDEGLCRTHLLINSKNDEVIGFFSLHNEAIDFKRDYGKKIEQKIKEKDLFPHTKDRFKQFPSIVLLYFALHRDYQGEFLPFNNERYSTILIGDVFKKVKEVAEHSGCMLITLEATPNSIGFYKRHGFETFKEKEIVDQYNHMMFPIKYLLD